MQTDARVRIEAGDVDGADQRVAQVISELASIHPSQFQASSVQDGKHVLLSIPIETWNSIEQGVFREALEAQGFPGEFTVEGQSSHGFVA